MSKIKPDLEYLKKHAPKAYAKLMKPVVESKAKMARDKRQARLERIHELMNQEIKLGGE